MAVTGSLELFSLPDILEMIHQGQKSGTLEISSGPEHVLFYFNRGRIASMRDSWGYLEQILSTFSRNLDGEERDAVREIFTMRLLDVLIESLQWKTGAYIIEERAKIKPFFVLREPLSVPELLYEGLRLADEGSSLPHRDLDYQSLIRPLNPPPPDTREDEENHLLQFISEECTLWEMLAGLPYPRYSILEMLGKFKDSEWISLHGPSSVGSTSGQHGIVVDEAFLTGDSLQSKPIDATAIEEASLQIFPVESRLEQLTKNEERLPILAQKPGFLRLLVDLAKACLLQKKDFSLARLLQLVFGAAKQAREAEQEELTTLLIEILKLLVQQGKFEHLRNTAKNLEDLCLVTTSHYAFSSLVQTAAEIYYALRGGRAKGEEEYLRLFLDLLEAPPEGRESFQKYLITLAAKLNEVHARAAYIRALDHPVLFRECGHLLEQETEEAIPALVALMAESVHKEVRLGVLERLRKFGPKCEEILRATLDDERWYVKRNCLDLLSTCGVNATVPKVLAQMAESEGLVRKQALQTFCDLRGKDSVDVLVREMASQDQGIRLQAIKLLGEKCGEIGLHRAGRALNSREYLSRFQDLETQVAIIQALGEIGDSQCSRYLLPLFEPKSEIWDLVWEEAQREAVGLLVKMKEKNLLKDLADHSDPAVQRLGKRAYRELVHEHSVRALGQHA